MSNSSYVQNAFSTASGLVRETRPQQWYKQSVLLIAIVFSKSLLNVEAWVDVLVGVAAFTTIAGATYVFNDISDVEEDRKHPEKRNRPIASGQVSVPVAAGFGLALAAVGLLAAYTLGVRFLLVLLAYVGQNAVYSLALKDIIFVDVLVVAVGFVLRAIAGVVAIDVFLSPWLIVCTFLLAMVLALGKRRHELESVSNPAETRTTLDEYTPEVLDQLFVVSTAMLLMAYSLYTFFRADITMMITLPFAFFGVFRYNHLVHTSEVAGKPEYLLTDRPSLVNAVLWAVTAIAVLYNVPTDLLGVLG